MIKLYRNERVVSSDDIPSYIKELNQSMRDWQLFRSAACYMYDNVETC